ncbi:MAG: DUF1292 domain-containing protein [Oscillospiraceae bacterium]|nr:DUF1292 domain-containing protein [Oscillospiraceae bacterium]
MAINKEELETEEMDVITLEEDGVEKEYAILAAFDIEYENDETGETDGEASYVALAPVLPGDVVDDENILFMQLVSDESEDEVVLGEIESEEELQAVISVFKELTEEDL